MNAPSVVIRLPLEGAPQVTCDWLDSGEESRMIDWLEAHPRLLALIGRAAELSDEARAA